VIPHFVDYLAKIANDTIISERNTFVKIVAEDTENLLVII
jgi:hypothetical protein